MKKDAFEIFYDRLSRLSRILNSFENEAYEKLNITQRQNSYLELIFILENPTVSVIAERLKFSKPTVTIAINRLIEEGYAQKVQSDIDKRSFSIVLTEKGKNIVKSINEQRKEAVKYLSASLSQKEMIKLAWYLNKIIDSEII